MSLQSLAETQAGLVSNTLMWENDGGFWHISIRKPACARQPEILFLRACSIVNTSLVYFYWVNLGPVWGFFFLSQQAKISIYFKFVVCLDCCKEVSKECKRNLKSVVCSECTGDMAWWGLRQICFLSLSHVTVSVTIADLQWCNIIWTLRLLTNVTLKQSMCFSRKLFVLTEPKTKHSSSCLL